MSSITPTPSFGSLESLAPPSNIEAEETVLGGVLIDENAFERVGHLLFPEHFYVAAHQEIYRQMVWLNGRDQPIDLISLISRLSDINKLESIGGQAKIIQLVDRTVSAVNIDRHAALIVDKSRRRQLRQGAIEQYQLASDCSKDLDEVVDACQQAVFSVSSAKPTDTGAYVANDIAILEAQISQRCETSAPLGHPTEFYDLNEMLGGGLQSGDLVLVAGRPSMGKTALAMQVAYDLSLTTPVAVFSLEMSRQQLQYRMLSAECGISTSDLRNGNIKDHQWTAYYDGVEQLAKRSNLYIDDRSNPTVSEIAATARQIALERGGELGAIVIDYLQLMGGGGDKNRANELGDITRGLKILARELNTTVIALSQLSRGVEARTNKRPMMADLRDSGALEQDADVIAMIYRDEYYNPDTTDRGITEVLLTKNRNGETGTVKLLFEAQRTRFCNMTNYAHSFAPIPQPQALPA